MTTVEPRDGREAARPVDGNGRSSVTLEDKYRAKSGRVLMSGIESLVRLVLEQRWLDLDRGFNTSVFITGYEGSPLGGLDLEMQRARPQLDDAGAVFTPGLNEELAATAIAGTQLVPELPRRRHDGVVGFWYGKNPGLDRAADAIRHANYSGTTPLGGAVAWIGDDPTCKSSTIPSSCEALCRSLAVPVLAPGSIAEVIELGLHSVALSRFAGVWTSLKMVADIADGAATIAVSSPAHWVPRPDLTREAHAPMLVGPRSVDAEEHLFETRLPRVTEYAQEVGLNHVAFEPHRPRLGIVASGLAYASVLRALQDLGLDTDSWHALGLRLVKVAMPWPLDRGDLRRLTRGLREVIVIEDKLAFIESQLKEALYHQAEQPVIVGKQDAYVHPLVPMHGAVDGDLVARLLAARLPEHELPEVAQARIQQLHRRRHTTIKLTELPVRTPYFCSGCPHNISTRAGEDQLVGLGIGCHIMVAYDTKGRGHQLGMTQMGGEGAQWIGMAPFTDDAHYVQNLGDGTFFHSGSLAIRAAIAAGVNITYKLLYNDAVAMTGGQSPHGRFDVPTLTRWLAVEGVRKVVVTTPEPAAYRRTPLDPVAEVRHRDDLQDAMGELCRIPGVTVLIHDDRCAAEERRLRKRGSLPTPRERVWINSRVCEGCGDCGEKSSCLSVVPVETEFGRKTMIHQGSCNQDYSCLKGNCPSFLVLSPKKARHRAPSRSLPVELTEPTFRRPEDEVLIRIPGVGGTGVVTVSRVLQMAALLDGRHAAGVEQTGLSQKGGPVVSDVRISAHPIEGAVAATEHTADLLLGFDLLGAANPRNLAVADPERTIAVVNTARVATAAMVRDTGVGFPALGSVEARIDHATCGRFNAYVNAEWIAERLFGDHLATNMVLLGSAYQLGCIPIAGNSIEQAIQLNGTAAETNVTAFRWGRGAVIDAEAVRRTLSPSPLALPVSSKADAMLADTMAPDPLSLVLRPRVADLVGYQSTAYARRYLDDVLSVANVERERTGSTDLPVAQSYARGLHKLMAYKDEYEVARLHLDPVERAKLVDEFGPKARPRVMLQPPVLKALGLRRKIHLGPVSTPAFHILRTMRHLRGTPFDLFGYARMRRAERGLVVEYRSLMGAALDRLGSETVEQVRQVAELPDLIRGFDKVKQANIETFRLKARALLDLLEDAPSGRPGPHPADAGPIGQSDVA
jgi:indolepyruvate ferredoxin oxidoreductase